jgi:hypothetical protein
VAGEVIRGTIQALTLGFMLARRGWTNILLSNTVDVVSKNSLPDVLLAVPASCAMVGNDVCCTPPKVWPHATS